MTPDQLAWTLIVVCSTYIVNVFKSVYMEVRREEDSYWATVCRICRFVFVGVSVREH